MGIAKKELAAALAAANVLKVGAFTLKSGAKSPIYVDLRQIPSVPKAMDAVTDALAETTRALNVEIVAGAETAGIPLAAVVAHKTGLPMIYVRKEPKGYGTGSQIEGILEPGRRVVLMDDLITHGTSKLIFLNALDAAGADAKDTLVILDREQGGSAEMAAREKRLHALLTLRELLSELVSLGALSEERYRDIGNYLNDPAAWEAAHAEGGKR